MPTKVISAKVSEEDYDSILNTCNSTGCTISQFVKDACFVAIGKGSEFSESDETLKKEPVDKIISELENKITKLEFQLSEANNIISKKNQEIREFYDLVPSNEVSQRRLERQLHKMKNTINCL